MKYLWRGEGVEGTSGVYLYYAILATLSGLTLAASQTTTILIPDQPVQFFVQLYNSTSDCSGNAEAAYLSTRGTFVDITISGGGSAITVNGEETVYYLAAYTGLGRTGAVIPVENMPNTGIDLGGTGAQSRSDDSVFGKKQRRCVEAAEGDAAELGL